MFFVSKAKTLKAPFIKFEAINKQYRPVKSELGTWPRLNLSAPPGICPFGGGKLAVQQKFGPRVISTVKPQDPSLCHTKVKAEENEARIPNIENK